MQALSTSAWLFSLSGVSQPTEFKAWNLSLRFLTLPCLFVSAGSLGPSSLGWCSSASGKLWLWPFKATGELGSFPRLSSSPTVELGWGPFSMTITRRLFSRVRSAVTYRASPPFSLLWGGDSGGGGWEASPSPWCLLVFRLQQRPTLPDTVGSITFSGKERLRLMSKPRGQLLSAWAALSWEVYLEHSSRTSGQLKVSVSKGLRGLRAEGRDPGEVVLGLTAEGLKEKRRGEVSTAEGDLEAPCS